jgi:hypothetical protein
MTASTLTNWADSPGGLSGRLHGRQQQRNENADDGNHHQQLD